MVSIEDKKLRSSKIIFCITGNIAIVILSLALLAVFVYLLEDSQRHVPKNFLNSSTKSIAPSPSEPILIKCYDMYQVESVVVNRTQGIEFYTIYQSKLQSSMENSLLPPIKIGPFVEIFNNSVRLNYNGDDLPVYTADTGYIMLEVSGKTINPDTCAVELLLFNDLHQFHNFLNDEQFTRLNNTCLNLDEQIHNMRVNFTLSTPGFYYVGARVLDGLSMNVTVTVSRAVFNSSRLTKEKCIDKTCEVKISKSSVPIGKGRKKCLFVQFPSDGIEADGVLQIEVKYLKFNAVSLCYMILATSSALVIIFVCIFTTIIIITITFKRCKKRFSSPFLEEGDQATMPTETTSLIQQTNPCAQRYSSPSQEEGNATRTQSTLSTDNTSSSSKTPSVVDKSKSDFSAPTAIDEKAEDEGHIVIGTISDDPMPAKNPDVIKTTDLVEDQSEKRGL